MHRDYSSVVGTVESLFAADLYAAVSKSAGADEGKDQESQTSHNRTEKAVQRTAPMAMFLHSLTVVWHATDGYKDFKIPERPWYWWKTEPSFADMLTTLRRKSWEDKLSAVSLDTTQQDIDRNLLTYLATLAG